MENKPNLNKSSSDSHSEGVFDLLVDLYHMVFLRVKFLISSFCILIVSLVTYSLIVEESYRSSTIINHVDNDEGGLSSFGSQLGGLSSLASFGISSQDSRKNVNIATLTSRVFLEDFITTENLSTEMLARSSYTPSTVPDWYLYKTLRDKINISEDLKTGLVTLSVDWYEPSIASDWANKLVSSINNKIRLQDIEEAKQNISFLEKEIQKTKLTEVQKLMYSIMQKQTETMMLANVKKEYAFKVINPAYPPELRFFPQRKLIVIVGTILGGLGIFLAIFVFEFIKRFREKLT